MTVHDTWVKLIPCPMDPIIHLFPDRMIPMRDPFPLETDESGTRCLMVIDLQRLSSVQANAIAQIYAQITGVSPDEVATDAAAKGGFALQFQWIESMQGGPECFARTKELADWMDSAPNPPSSEAWTQFYQDQHRRWIEGDEVPPPINSLEDIDPRLWTPELQLRAKTNELLANYSAFDVLTGRAFVDVLNQLDDENAYSLWCDDDLDEEDIYE